MENSVTVHKIINLGFQVMFLNPLVLLFFSNSAIYNYINKYNVFYSVHTSNTAERGTYSLPFALNRGLKF